MVLRPTTASRHEVIGVGHVHGLSDGEPLLGPLPPPWQFRVKPDGTGLRVHYFHNASTGEDCSEDPRLGSLPSDWEPFKAETARGEAERTAWFRHSRTGETLNSDPRLLPAALSARGINVRVIQFV
jgi:hypothetical protein